MPIVPFTQRQPSSPQPSPTFLMMAAADLHEAGMLFEPESKSIEPPKPEKAST